MKMRVNGSILGITIAALGLTLGCGDDSSDGSSDAGLEAGAADDGTSTADDTTPTDTDTDDGDDTTPTDTDTDDGDDTTPTDTDTETDTDTDTDSCDEDVSIICDGDDRVRIDPCDTSGPEVLETCDSACDQGRCVDCAPRGVVCEDGDVYPIDSCDQLGDVSEECSNGCSVGACIAEECLPSDDTQCVGNLLFALNSCGDQTNVLDLCENGCVDGACVGCVDEGETLCYAGDVYPVDSCGSTGDVAEECVASCSVSSTGDTETAECSDVVCEATLDVECFRGDMYSVDSCGGIVDEVVTDCHNGCDEDGCLPCVPAPDGVTCFDGDVYDTVGGCDDPSVRAETVKEECEFGCFNGACTEEGECVPAGTVCVDGSVHSVDTCEQVGPVVETCIVSCELGACTGVGDGGVDPVDAGGDDASVPTEAGTDVIDSGTGEDAGLDGAVDAGADADAAL